MTNPALDLSTDAAFRAARRHLSSSLWIGVAMLWIATIALTVATVVMWGSTTGWVCLFFVVLFLPFAVGVAAMAVSDRRTWSAVAAGKVPVETRTGRGLGISNSQGRQVVAYGDVAKHGTADRPFLHLTLPPADNGGPEIRGPVRVEVFSRTGRQRTIDGPVRVSSSDGRHVWWAGNAAESRDRFPEVTETQTSVT